MKFFCFAILGIATSLCFAQTNRYEISFENAVHHEANIKVVFPNITSDTLTVRMSRTSPGRYALHEFAKNVYNFEAVDSQGRSLPVARPNPYAWQITGHDGTVTVRYTLFANRGDGTYSQIDETHAHLNIPATFMYAPQLADRSLEVDFKVRTDLGWKVATQLPLVSETTYSAPNLYYFMDSPTELSNFHLRSFEVGSPAKKQTIQLALHHQGTQEETDTYFESVKKIVLAEREVYGRLPDFDYGTYTFLACYIPNASGDGMEHRNSTILTSTRSLAKGGMSRNLGTVSHEFFHAWNVERIRPESLEPFDFENANMSGALWFAEGFTSYYTNLILCRAGLISPEKYVEGLTGTFNYVWNSPARQFFNPIEMSYQAPFVDAATSVDPVNRTNTFISYYSYGSMLGLALDLSLREKGLNLDDYMKQVWQAFGAQEKPYRIEDLHKTLNTYAGQGFGDDFFNTYIYRSGMPDYPSLLKSVGVSVKQPSIVPYTGLQITYDNLKRAIISGSVKMGSPAYQAGLNKGDYITAINNRPITVEKSLNDQLHPFKIGDVVEISFERYGMKKSTRLILGKNPEYSIYLNEKEGIVPSKKTLTNRAAWLGTK